MAIDDVKDLPPDERIKRLKEIEEEKKREIEEAEALIRDSMIEIDESAQEQHAPRSVQQATDITQLVSAEEKQIFRNVTGASEGEIHAHEEPQVQRNLEQVAQEEAPEEEKKEDDSPGVLYGTNANGDEQKSIYGGNDQSDIYGGNQDQKDIYHENQSAQAGYLAAKEDQEQREQGYHSGDDFAP